LICLYLFFLIFLIFFSLRIKAKQSRANFFVEISKIKSERKGQICLSVFSIQQGFPENWRKASYNFCKKIAIDQKQVFFKVPIEAIKTKTVAISVLHDQNQNYQQDYFLLKPKEGFGFSNNAFKNKKSKIPSFFEAEVGSDLLRNRQIKINLVYL